MSDTETISIMLVDDHFVVRSGLAASLNLEDDIVIAAELENGEDVAEAYQTSSPSVVLMDLQLPGINGIAATEQLIKAHPSAKVLIFSTFAREDEIRSAMEKGARGYLQKSASREELISAIKTVAEGDTYLAADVRETLHDLENLSNITPREREILALVAKGNANKEIGSTLGIAEDTVKRHISNIFQKFGVSDRAQATAEAIRRGIVSV